MNHLFKILFYFVLSFSFLSCSSDDEKPNFSRDEFLKMAREGDPNLEVIVPSSFTESLVNCGDYKPACRYGYRVKIKRIDAVVLFYEDQKNALAAAKRIKGFVARNWVFDEVRGEPILERFVKKYTQAVDALEAN